MGLEMHDVDAEAWSALLSFAEDKYGSLARKMVARLQKIPASGVFSDDYQHKTLWDEFCHDIQYGPYDLLEGAWDITILPLANDIIHLIPNSEGRLLTMATDNFAFEGKPVFFTPDLVCDQMLVTLRGIASKRDMGRFDPD